MMALLSTPVCDFGSKIKNFKLLNIDNEKYDLNSLAGEKGSLIMFICNHCPYVKAIIKKLVLTTQELKKNGINSIAIMPNDFIKYPEDNFDNMKIFAKENRFNFPYLIDESQNVAKNFGAVCTPDFFGYNQEGKLNYRGRIGEMNNLQFVNEKNELLEAMIMISTKNKGPEIQYPSAGCSIKWKN
jgi:peroxiredoxin